MNSPKCRKRRAPRRYSPSDQDRSKSPEDRKQKKASSQDQDRSKSPEDRKQKKASSQEREPRPQTKSKREHEAPSGAQAAPSGPSTSLSVGFRQRGNVVYGAGLKCDNNKEKQAKFQEALNLYYRALSTAEEPREKISAKKNYGLVSVRLSQAKLSEKQETVVYYLKQGITSLDNAVALGKEHMTVEWIDETTKRLLASLKTLQDYLDRQPGKPSRKADILVGIGRWLSVEVAQLELYSYCGQLYFHEAIRARERGDFKLGLSCVSDGRYPMEEMKRLAAKLNDPLQAGEAEVLESDLLMVQCALESQQAIASGNEVLEKAMNSYENLPMTLVWQAVDYFKHASLCAREIEVEQEAIAVSKLGAIYAKVLKIEHRARECFVYAFQLAMSLHPKTFESDDWYKEAKFLLSNLQYERQEAERKKKEEERKQYLDELKEEVEALDNECQQDRGESLLEFVYKEHPPKDDKFKLYEKYKEETKKALQKAITHYHPDRQKEEYGKKWQVLCEEITKCLTSKYECMKGE